MDRLSANSQAKWSTRTLVDHEKLSRQGGVEKKRGKGNTESGPLAALMPLKLSDLTPAKVASWLDAESATRPTQTALAYRMLRAFVRWCAHRDEYRNPPTSKPLAPTSPRTMFPVSRRKKETACNASNCRPGSSLCATCRPCKPLTCKPCC